ncbi:hypothetical protein [Seohaeicola zhoushanensis]|uniref:Histidinol phosphate aminotransferase n=1 Tax=Seohaeicola zhoushanensis TaxID=1569283 RepID=A0A8J3H1M1_9RHOB|nr:hypothetical protein [Seohaeicola zhoushanensis]GHF67721.1 hypothetical protein GCM10017056_43610 [Seohaeicola zhoushanensis]
MQHQPLGVAPNYTTAALVMLGVNFAWVFFALWAAAGLIPVLLLAAGINHLISRLAARRRA